MEKNLTSTTESTREAVNLVPIIDGESGPVTGKVTMARACKEIKNARSNTERAKTFNALFDILCDNTVTTICLTLLNLLPLYILIVGAAQFHNCPAERRIPVYMVVDGIVFLIRTGIFFLLRHDPTVSGNQYWKLGPKALVNLFLFAWLICGSIWIFQAHPDLEDEFSPHYCHKVAYLSAYIYVILQWIALPLGLLIGLCMFVSAVCAHREPAVVDELTCV